MVPPVTLPSVVTFASVVIPASLVEPPMSRGVPASPIEPASGMPPSGVSVHDGVVRGVFTQPDAPSHESLVHSSESSQSRTVPAVHMPDAQTSTPLHAFESSQSPSSAHGMQSSIIMWRHPIVLSQVSAVHELLSSQSGVPE